MPDISNPTSLQFLCGAKRWGSAGYGKLKIVGDSRGNSALESPSGPSKASHLVLDINPPPAEMADPSYTVFVRVPIPRGSFVDPPAVGFLPLD